MSDALRKEIRKVLTDWDSGKLTAQAVQHWAAATSAKDSDAYTEKVIHQLRGLGEYLITVDDIAIYLEGLELPAELGIKHLELEGASFDVKARATDLKDDPFYGPHTRAILKELS
ncbi:MAG: hypothetical protein KDB90_13740 [Planctomycetes bacterium]|nr:hypothetical protein [Planctomycetota bacterium]